jgi:hypothetical protein
MSSILYGDDKRETHEQRADWFAGIEGHVVKVDSETFSVKVLIDSVDAEMYYDVWVPVLTPYAGGDGYGMAFMPAVGSEVVLFSRGNEGLNLFAISRFNEERRPPQESRDGSLVIKTPRALKLIAELLILIQSDEVVTVRGGAGVDCDAPDVRLMSGGSVGVHAQGSAVGFLGKGPVGRQHLPGPAVDPASTMALANAIRQALINFGLCD